MIHVCDRCRPRRVVAHVDRVDVRDVDSKTPNTPALFEVSNPFEHSLHCFVCTVRYTSTLRRANATKDLLVKFTLMRCVAQFALNEIIIAMLQLL